MEDAYLAAKDEVMHLYEALHGQEVLVVEKVVRISAEEGETLVFEDSRAGYDWLRLQSCRFSVSLSI